MAPVATGLAFFLCLTGCLSLQPKRISPEGYYWAGKNGDLLRTGSANYGANMSAVAAGPSWSFHEKDNSVIRAAPLIDDKKNIYISTIPGMVHKFSPDGLELWSYDGSEGGEIPGIPCLYKGSMFFTNRMGFVTKLNMETGQKIWSKPALVKRALGSAPDTWSMTASEGTVLTLVSSDWQINDFLVALDTETGDVKWSFKTDETIYNSLQDIHEGSVVLSDYTGKVYRLNLDTGDLIWKAGPAAEGERIRPEFSTGGTVMGPNEIVYTTSNARDAQGHLSGFLTAFRFRDGKVLWRHATEYAANNGAVVGMMNGRLSVAIGVGENPDMPTAAQVKYHLQDNDYRLKEKKARVVALDASTGGELWRRELPAWHGWAAGDMLKNSHICLPDSFGNPALGPDGTVYVGFESGAFYGINDKNDDGSIDESEIVMYNTHNAFQGSPALAPGMVVATPCNGLYVFKTPMSGSA